MTALRRARTALLTGALAASFAVALAQPASAAAPITRDDHVSMYAGQMRVVKVLANDSDPDGDTLAICRIGQDSASSDKYFVDFSQGELLVGLNPGVKGPITITYYACDYETLVPATLTIDVKKVVPVTATKADRPGRLRFTNKNDRAVKVLYGSLKEDHPDGTVRVPAHSSAVARVHRHRIFWIAILDRTAMAGRGHVRGIELPAGDHVPAPGKVRIDRAEARAWTAR